MRARILLATFFFLLMILGIVGLLYDGALHIERCGAGYFGGHNTFGCIAESHWVTQADFDCDDDGSIDVRGWYHDASQLRSCEQWRGGWREISLAECACTCAREGFALRSIELLDAGCASTLPDAQRSRE